LAICDWSFVFDWRVVSDSDTAAGLSFAASAALAVGTLKL
jgi:hypothetical protein